MGKSMPSLGRIQELTRVITSTRIHQRPRARGQIKPQASIVQPLSSPQPSSKLSAVFVESKNLRKHLKVSKNMGENSVSDSSGQERRIPLADVVADCAKRWFQDTLKEAKAGDSAMQVLVSQMYRSGYGIPANPKKAEAWMLKASKTVRSVWKVTDKHPGYHASDSDSEEVKSSNK